MQTQTQSLGQQSLVIFNTNDTQYPVIKQVAYSILKFQPLIDPTKEEWDILWTDNAIPPEQLSHMKPFQKINHFPSMYSLSRKNHLARHLMRMRKKFPEEYSFFPVTWLLPAEFPDFSNEIKQKSKVFIIKPQASSQGRGIFLTNNSDIIDKNEHYVAQRYINNPYLIEGLKFDCRVYVLLTGCDPLRIYLYNEGLARFATEEYESPNEENLVNSCMHLTNYAINKKSKNFIFNEKEENDDIGHKRSLSSLFEILRKKGENIDELMKNIKDLINKTICSVQPILSHCYKSCQPQDFYNNMCFEILGFDILLDEKLKPWLLEVNHTPSFNTDTPLDNKIKTNLIRDTLNILDIKAGNRMKFYETLRRNLKTAEQRRKISPDSRFFYWRQAQFDRDRFEEKNQGGFLKISCNEKYEKFREFALKSWEEMTGTNKNRKKMTKTVEVEEKGQKELEFLQYKLNKTIKLQKIYLQKVANPNVQNKKLLLPLKISKELKNLDDKPKKENFLRKNKLVFRLKKTD